MTAPLEMVMVGAGHRARDAYGPFAEQHPDQARIVAVAEPNPIRRRQMAERFDIADEMCFGSWQDLVARTPRPKRTGEIVREASNVGVGANTNLFTSR